MGIEISRVKATMCNSSSSVTKSLSSINGGQVPLMTFDFLTIQALKHPSIQNIRSIISQSKHVCATATPDQELAAHLRQ